jgi:hypothetical protein
MTGMHFGGAMGLHLQSPPQNSIAAGSAVSDFIIGAYTARCETKEIDYQVNQGGNPRRHHGFLRVLWPEDASRDNIPALRDSEQWAERLHQQSAAN